MVFQRIWNFVKRHRGKFVTVGVLVGGGYAAIRYIQWRVKRFQDEEMEDALLQARKRHHFECNQRTCNTTALSLLPNLREALKKELDTESLTKKLKTKPANKVEIWEHLKVLSFTRALVSVYCNCFLVILLRIQLNIVGGYMLMDSLKPANGIIVPPPTLDDNTKRQYMEIINYIFKGGLTNLVRTVKAAVEKEMLAYSLKHRVNAEDVQVVIQRVRTAVERPEGTGLSDLLDFPKSLHSPPSEDRLVGSVSFEKLVAETRDVLQSSDFQFVLRRTVDHGFTRLARLVESSLGSLVHAPVLSSDEGKVPLAKVIPAINNLINVTCSDPPNQFVQDLLLLHQVTDFGANVYESFCQPPASS